MRLPLSIDSARKRVGEVRRQIEQGEWALAMAQSWVDWGLSGAVAEV